MRCDTPPSRNAEFRGSFAENINCLRIRVCIHERWRTQVVMISEPPLKVTTMEVIAKAAACGGMWGTHCAMQDSVAPRAPLQHLNVTQRALSVPQRALSITQQALNIPQRALSVPQRALTVTQRALSVTQRAISVTQRALSVAQQEMPNLEDLFPGC